MKFVVMALIAIFMFSCGGPEVDCKDKFSAGGMKICSEGSINADEVELTVKVVEEQTAVYYPQVSNLKDKLAKHKVHVFFIDDPLSMECEELEHGIYRCDKHIGGVNVDGDTIYVMYHECLAYTALAHEILHSIEKYYLSDIPHGDHETPNLFEQNPANKYLDTVEYRTFKQLFDTVDSCAEQREKYGY